MLKVSHHFFHQKPRWPILLQTMPLFKFEINIMRCWLIFVCIIFCCLPSFVEAKNLLLFNTAVLGSSTQDNPQLFYDKKPGDIEPLYIQVDVEKGKYRGAIVCYPLELSFEEARTSINKLYKQYEKESLVKDWMGAWRLEDENFAIMLSKEEEHINVIYNQFVTNDVLFKKLFELLCEQEFECEKEKAGKELFSP